MVVGIVKKYPAKLLLFGEYTVLSGGKALAIPLSRFFGSWKVAANADLDSFFDYILHFDWGKATPNREKISTEAGNVQFESNIPYGYGLGSSAALSAAVYERYFETSDDILEVKSVLANLENYFHGSSSGFDPLISFYNSAFLNSSEGPKPAPFKLPSDIHIYLLDSKIDRNAKHSIQAFHENASTAQHFKSDLRKMNAINETIIHDLVSHGKMDQNDLSTLSENQLSFYSYLIPPSLIDTWKHGHNSKEYYLKLCGAGGGGFFLVFSENKALEIPEFRLHGIL